jgi:hypothetical protein
MSERGPERIRGLLGDVGKRLGVESAVETGVLWRRWREIVGPEIAAHASPSSLKDGVLRVRADSPAWAQEIGYLGTEIARKANSATRSELVREVRVWTGPPPEVVLDDGSSAESEPFPPKPPKESPEEALEAARVAWAKRWRRGGSSPSGRL